jgi:hypothetical protein
MDSSAATRAVAALDMPRAGAPAATSRGTATASRAAPNFRTDLERLASSTPRTKTRINSNVMAWTMPASGVRPPVRTFVAVRAIAPVAGKPGSLFAIRGKGMACIGASRSQVRTRAREARAHVSAFRP